MIVEKTGKGVKCMRRKYLDNIRWMTVALVVVYHVLYIFNAQGVLGGMTPFSDVQYQDVLLPLVYPWFMALLFIVSGMSVRFYLEKHTAKEFRHSRTVKLLVPSTLGLLVFFWIAGWVNMTISHAFETMSGVPGPILYLIMCLSGTGPLWYIQLLWVFSMALLLIRRIEKDRLYNVCANVRLPVLIALAAPVWAAAQVLNTPVVTVYRFGLYGICFLLGYFVFAHDEVIARVEKACVPLAVVAAVLGVVYVCLTFGHNYAEEPALSNPLAVGYLWITCLAILGCMKRFGDRSTPLTDFMNRESWGLYVFHYLPLSACALLLRTKTDLPAAAVYALTAVAAFAGAFALYHIVSRIPVLRFLTLGIENPGKRKERNHAA